MHLVSAFKALKLDNLRYIFRNNRKFMTKIFTKKIILFLNNLLKLFIKV